VTRTPVRQRWSGGHTDGSAGERRAAELLDAAPRVPVSPSALDRVWLRLNQPPRRRTRWQPSLVVVTALIPAAAAAAWIATDAPVASRSEERVVASPPASRPRAPFSTATPPPVTEAPAPTATASTPSQRTPRLETRPESDLAKESKLLGAALTSLRRDKDAHRALSLLDEYQRSYPRGSLAAEAAVARVDALRALGRNNDALSILDGLSLERLPRSRELRVLRGELRAARGRCVEAVTDFSRALDDTRQGYLGERALSGSAACRERLGDQAGARREWQRYLEQFPAGRLAPHARNFLKP
jgi:TolA-binding protein